MKEKKIDFIFKLTKPIKVQNEKQGGGFDIKEYKELKLVAPSKKNQYIVGDRLQGMYSLAAIRMARESSTGKEIIDDNEEKEPTEKEKEAGIRLILITGLQDDTKKFHKAFGTLLLKKGICYAGENELSETDLAVISHKDFKELIVKYILNFFYTCWMKILNGN